MARGLSQPTLRAALLVAAAASLVILAGVLPDAVRYACVGVVALATLACGPERHREGGGWWSVLALGAALTVAGALLALASETLGGLVAVVGGVLVVAAAAIGFPADQA